MAGLRPYIVSFALIILFSIACFSFMSGFLISNNPNSQELSDPYINQSLARFSAATTELQNASANAQALIDTDKPSLEFIFLIFRSAFDIPRSFLNFITLGISSILDVVFTQLIGIGMFPLSIVFAIFNAILLIAAIFLIISFIRTGQGER